MTHFDAYLLTRLSSFSALFGIIFIFSLFACIIIGVTRLAMNDELEESRLKILKKGLKISLFSFAFSGVFCALIPSSKEAAFIYIAPAIVNNKDVQKTIKQVPELSALGLEYLKETLKEEIKKKTK